MIEQLFKNSLAHEHPLIRHMVEGTVHALDGASEEEAGQHVAAFLHALHHLAPEMFAGHEGSVPSGMEQAGETGWDAHLKKNMSAKGYHYFGKLTKIFKHLYGEIGSGPGNMDVRGFGPRGLPNPHHSKQHSNKPAQEVHGRGSGKRTLMSVIRAWADANPTDPRAAKLPTWNEMDGVQEDGGQYGKTVGGMTHEEVIEIADSIGVLGETRGGTVNVVDMQPGGKNVKHRKRDISDHASVPERGAGASLNRKTALAAAVHVIRENKKLSPESIRAAGKRLGVYGEAKTPEAKELPKGKRGLGAHDPNETVEAHPSMNSLKDKIQRKAQKLKNDEKREKSPKVHINDLPDVPVPDRVKVPAKVKEKVRELASVGAPSSPRGKAPADSGASSEKSPEVPKAEATDGAAWSELDGSAERLHGLINSNPDGITFNGTSLDDDEKTHPEGYYASFKDSEVVLENPTKQDIKDFLTQHKEAIQDDNFGAWKEGGKVYLDVSRHFSDKDEAIKFGEKNDQLAIFGRDEGVISLKQNEKPKSTKTPRTKEERAASRVSNSKLIQEIKDKTVEEKEALHEDLAVEAAKLSRQAAKFTDQGEDVPKALTRKILRNRIQRSNVQTHLKDQHGRDKDELRSKAAATRRRVLNELSSKNKKRQVKEEEFQRESDQQEGETRADLKALGRKRQAIRVKDEAEEKRRKADVQDIKRRLAGKVKGK